MLKEMHNKTFNIQTFKRIWDNSAFHMLRVGSAYESCICIVQWKELCFPSVLKATFECRNRGTCGSLLPVIRTSAGALRLRRAGAPSGARCLAHRRFARADSVCCLRSVRLRPRSRAIRWLSARGRLGHFIFARPRIHHMSDELPHPYNAHYTNVQFT